MILAGVLVTLPAYLLFGASLRNTLAFQMNGFEIPHRGTRHVGLHRRPLPALAWSTTKSDLRYAFVEHPAVGLSLAVGLLSLFALPAEGDALMLYVMRGAALGCLVVFALDPDFSGFRYELTFLPSAAAEAVRPGRAHRDAIRRARAPAVDARPPLTAPSSRAGHPPGAGTQGPGDRPH